MCCSGSVPLPIHDVQICLDIVPARIEEELLDVKMWLCVIVCVRDVQRAESLFPDVRLVCL